ncbi:hypothetical protein M5689_006929 [Euphorbia peplus]|nr:hypothetical protein M5689_006929 [Euphorbia peplus]
MVAINCCFRPFLLSTPSAPVVFLSTVVSVPFSVSLREICSSFPIKHGRRKKKSVEEKRKAISMLFFL